LQGLPSPAPTISNRIQYIQRTVDRNTALLRLQDDGVLGQTTDANAAIGSPVTAANSAATNSTATNATNANTAQPAANPAPDEGTFSRYPAISDYLWGSRYVAYQPEITLLELGTNLYIPSGSVVVSPDRRYVLMRLSPEFNTLTGVNAYNTASGQAGENPMIHPSTATHEEKEK